jgi:hypothetical protein
MVGPDLFGWTPSANGILEHLRVLDLGDNPGLLNADIDAVGTLELWEL